MAPLYLHMDVVFLVYGLAFFSLGLTIVVLNERDSALELSRVLWLLAAFGFVHGFHEWMDLWRVARGDNPELVSARPLVLLVSYLFLFEFGRRLVRAAQSVEQRESRASRLLSPWIYAPILLAILAGAIVSDHPMPGLAIWSRFVLGFAGPCLTGAGFYLYCHNRIGADSTASDYPGASNNWYIAAAAFVAYGVFGGLIGVRGDWPPAAVVNEESFLALFGVPVQLLRAGCAITAAVSVGQMLQIFRQNNRRKLSHALDIGQHALTEFYRVMSSFDAILDSTTEGIVGLNHTGKIMFVNDSALTMLGYRKEELVGKPFHILKHYAASEDNGWPVKDCPILLTLQTGLKHRSDDERLWRKNKTWFPVAYQAAPLHQGTHIRGVVVAFRDTAEAKLTERRLREIENRSSRTERQQMRIDPRVTA